MDCSKTIHVRQASRSISCDSWLAQDEEFVFCVAALGVVQRLKPAPWLEVVAVDMVQGLTLGSTWTN